MNVTLTIYVTQENFILNVCRLSEKTIFQDSKLYMYISTLMVELVLRPSKVVEFFKETR